MPDQTPDLLHRITAATAPLAGNTFIRRLLRELVEELPVTHAFVARVDDELRRGARVLVWSEASGEQRGALAGTAGEPTTFLGDDVADNAHRLRASCSIFAAAGIKRAFAVALIGSDGTHVGHLGVTDPAPGAPDEEQAAVLRLCAARAAAEIRRQRSERSTRALGEEQAALLRIATLVTQAAPPERLLRSVTTEAGLLYDGETARTLRFEDAATARVMGCWSEDGVLKVGLGDQVSLADDPAAAEVLRTGVAAHLDGDGTGGGSAIAASSSTATSGGRSRSRVRPTARSGRPPSDASGDSRRSSRRRSRTSRRGSSCPLRGRASSRPRTASAAGSSGTSTTARSSGSYPRADAAAGESRLAPGPG